MPLHHEKQESMSGEFVTQVRRTRALAVGSALVVAGLFFVALSIRWGGSDEPRQFLFASDVAWFMAVGIGNLAAGTWELVSAARTRHVVLDPTGIRVGRESVAWNQVAHVTVSSRSVFLSFGQSLRLTVVAPSTELTVDLFQLSCSSETFVAAFDDFADHHGIVVDR